MWLPRWGISPARSLYPFTLQNRVSRTAGSLDLNWLQTLTVVCISGLWLGLLTAALPAGGVQRRTSGRPPHTARRPHQDG
ncbi:hypothetical protein XAC3218_910168 [Xanthomonas citri pv. citri]|uniref:Uncharacterized protein n=1 Tax=Xanthomonas citri pv. citri TaxID=611301 RepID=A0A0U5FJ07_XANCI|nr:hypothetical protein XAC902_1040223 [Xanthomonas citri pv. citri]CEE21283.1 hypothetical protein XAC908_1050055 [Xanthomonas citri pv. citri]CEE38267.1 hypothetical protein XAC3824_880216 [Xanthomonas citri pv. citri]CEE48560.1 hypothetical protein XAC2911_790220 [Xanthomonas citri pv. citri]CEE52747.1 hypothetical protein XACS584_1220060 [Xanthomonas citri pv. citri]